MKVKFLLMRFFSYTMVIVLAITNVQPDTLSVRGHKIGGKDRMKNDSSIQSIFNPKMVKKFGFDKWYDKINGVPIRFYRFFKFDSFNTAWALTFKNSENSPMAFVLAETNCWFENKENSTKKILVTILECESIAIAHQMIFSKLQTISRIDPVLDIPEGWEIGDIYKAGYWARGNLFISVIDLSKSSLDNQELLGIKKSIDSQLCKIPTPCSDASLNKVIKSFRCESNNIPPLTLTSLVCELDDATKECSYLFIYKGGRVSFKNNSFFFTGYESGEHTIEVYITNPRNITEKRLCIVKVTQ